MRARALSLSLFSLLYPLSAQLPFAVPRSTVGDLPLATDTSQLLNRTDFGRPLLLLPREICAGERSNRRRRRGALWLDLGASGRGMLLLLLLLLFPVLFLFASSCRCSGSE